MVWHRWVQRGLLSLSVVLVACLVYLLLARTESPSPAKNFRKTFGRADAGINRFSFVQSKSGAVQWEVQARRAKLFEAESRVVLEEDVQVTLYGRNGWELKLDGDEGTVDTSKKNFLVAKRWSLIAVQLKNGYTIFTNHLVWTDQRQEVRTNDPVTISGNGVKVTGRGLIGKLENEEFQILENVRVDITS